MTDTPYATSDQMLARFGHAEILALTDLTNTGSIDETRLGQYLLDATDFVNGYLASRYALPLTVTPPLLSILTCDIARYRLCERPTEEMRARFTDAVAWLGSVAMGKITLGVDAGGNEPPSDTGPTSVSFTTTQRSFSSDLLNDYTRAGCYGDGQGRRGGYRS